MAAMPTEIRQGSPTTLQVKWADGTETSLEVFDIRIACPCANCVDEVTGVRRLDPDRIPKDVRPKRVTSVGNYALQIVWSDGHDTGIYSYEMLRRLGEKT